MGVLVCVWAAGQHSLILSADELRTQQWKLVDPEVHNILDMVWFLAPGWKETRLPTAILGGQEYVQGLTTNKVQETL